MRVQHAVLSIPKRHQTVSGDAHQVREDLAYPFVASVARAHGFLVLPQQIARFARSISVELVREGMFPTDVSEMTPLSFDGIECALREVFPEPGLGAAAACVSVDLHGCLRIAHLGNCRLFQYDPARFEGIVQLTEDHTPAHPAEEVRLQAYTDPPNRFYLKRHGEYFPPIDLSHVRLHVREEQDATISRSLRCTRGFGHALFRPAVSHEPEVQTFALRKDVPSLFALCTAGGSKLTRNVFRDFWQSGKQEIPSIDDIASLAHVKSAKKTKGPKHDTTIIFFRISP